MSIKSIKLIVALLKDKTGKPKETPKLWKPGKLVCVTKNDHGRPMVSVKCSDNFPDLVLAFYPDRILARTSTGEEQVIFNLLHL